MIVGTAGHIDHGKTALVRALTGIDADRLPEERKRGITIELGYAFMPTPAGMIGFVDMPGHEKLVRTMVAGASGIDFALLLIAADDGVMPQTIEHLAILKLLDVRRGAAVITKMDRVDEALLQQRITEAKALLEQAGIDYPVLPLSAMQGDGVDALRTLLITAAGKKEKRANDSDGFRMGLDRVFTLDGIGTVVAGSIAAGNIRIGDMLCLAHAPDQPYRVRSLHVHGHNVENAEAGQRCAIGLAGLERNAVERGQMLCDPAIAQATSRIDVWLHVADTEEKPLRSGTPVHLHLSTQDCMASVAILGQASIAPGESGWAQLVVQQDVHAWNGDRFILRDASASRTVAGGSIVDTAAPARYRQTPERLAFLETQLTIDAEMRTQGALAHAPFGIQGREWLRRNGWKVWSKDTARAADTSSAWLIADEKLAAIEAAALQAMANFHAKLPEEIGPDSQRLRRLAAPRMPETLWNDLIERMAGNGKLAKRNGFLHLPEHGVQLVAAEKAVAERALPLLLDGGFDPPWVRDVATKINLPEAQVRNIMARMAKGGDVYQVVKDLHYHPRAIRELASVARTIGERNGEIAAAAFRDATGLGRKRAIQILEFFDRIGFLRRVNDAHLLRTGTTLFPEEET